VARLAADWAPLESVVGFSWQGSAFGFLDISLAV
jgi:hypothetical protein